MTDKFEQSLRNTLKKSQNYKPEEHYKPLSHEQIDELTGIETESKGLNKKLLTAIILGAIGLTTIGIGAYKYFNKTQTNTEEKTKKEYITYHVTDPLAKYKRD